MKTMTRTLPLVFVLAACVQNSAIVPAGTNDGAVDAVPSAAATAVVRPGIEVFLADVPASLKGKRVGLITNHSAIDRARNLDIDLIAKHRDLKLVALFAPEHGIRGDAPAGQKIVDEKDPKTGVPVYSLYMS